METSLKLSDFIQLLPLLPITKKAALSVSEMARRFHRLPHEARPTGAQVRAMQRHLSDLSNLELYPWAPLEKIDTSHPPRYYLRNDKLLHWFMNDEMALNFLLTREALRVASGVTLGNLPALNDHATRLLEQSHEGQRLLSRLRMARSGIGRLPPRLDTDVLGSLLTAVRQDRQVRLEYKSAQGRVSTKDITIQGLVMKDDTLYVLSTNGLNDPPLHLVAHRILRAEVLNYPAQRRLDFDLDEYIEEHYQLSHLIDGHSMLDLELRVHDDALYHFHERRLSQDQTVAPDATRPGWHRLKASIPKTFMLNQFLHSMGPAIEILAPLDLREVIAQEARAAAALYDEGPAVS